VKVGELSDYFGTLFDESEISLSVRKHAKTYFMSLVGFDLDYYGADSGDHTFSIDKIVFKVFENPDDGYRSHLGPIDYSDMHSSLFFDKPIARVRIESFDADDCDIDDDRFWSSQRSRGYRLIDVVDGHVWLEFGTSNYDDYYPCFVFRHTPKEENKNRKLEKG
jgi:hypothetical protein